MKLVIQIPCLNEAATLPLVMKNMPVHIKGVDEIEVQIINDGSTDATVQVAEELGIKHIIRHTNQQGLGRSFADGVQHALERGADIVVNTDGDNQYPSERIGDLVQPIIDKRADIVVGDRQVHQIKHFSAAKKLFQHLGSKVVNIAAGTDIPDAASGFRAYSRQALLRLNTITTFSYCMETIIQAGNKRLAITSIPIETNGQTRESRLFKSNWEHIYKSGAAIVRAYIMYKPYMLFNGLGALFGGLGLIPFVRYLYFFALGERGSHLQSLIVGAVLLVGAFLSIALGILADLIRSNRILQEDALELIKQMRFKK